MQRWAIAPFSGFGAVTQSESFGSRSDFENSSLLRAAIAFAPKRDTVLTLTSRANSRGDHWPERRRNASRGVGSGSEHL
jgi:hypothetical protein